MSDAQVQLYVRVFWAGYQHVHSDFETDKHRLLTESQMFPPGVVRWSSQS